MSAGRLFSLLLLLWLAGTGTRLTILAVPPVIPLIRGDLGLSETDVGVLSGLPPVLFALAAIPGSLLIARLGAVQTLVAGLLICAVGSALRSASPDLFMLYVTTVALGFGVSVMHVALPPVVRDWLPRRIPLATAVYTNGLIIGEIVPVAMMLPLIVPLSGGSWRIGLLVWAAPLLPIALAIVAFAPRVPHAQEAAKLPRRWWPDWRNGTVWRLGFMLGCVNSMYFGTNAFLPDYVHALNKPELVSPALTALNLGQLPASLLLLFTANRMQRRAWPYVAIAVLCLIGYVGIFSGVGVWLVAGSGLIGFAAAGVLVLILALPPLLSAPEDVHRTTAAMFTISYSCAIVIPIVSGLVWDASHLPRLAFVPLAACTLLLASLALTFDFRSSRGWYVAAEG